MAMEMVHSTGMLVTTAWEVTSRNETQSNNTLIESNMRSHLRGVVRKRLHESGRGLVQVLLHLPLPVQQRELEGRVTGQLAEVPAITGE